MSSRKNMKTVFQKITGSATYYSLRDAKKKWFPSAGDKIEKERQQQRGDFYKGFVKEGNLCFDIGANLGNRITPLLHLKAKVVAAEPQHKCAAYLRKKFGNRIQLIEKGIGSKEEIRDFYMSDADVLSSFSKEWIDSVKQKRFKRYHWQKPVKMEMTTLDILIKKYGIPDFIKIDVEGFEAEVLKGLSHKIKMISYEYTTPEQTTKAIECIVLLSKISPSLTCNYCIGEEMHFALNNWLTDIEMIEMIKSDAFTSTRFGDIYVKM